MTTQKIAVSVPELVLARARHAVQRGHAPSLSAYVTSALEQKSILDDLDDMLREMLAESGGPLSVSERRRADKALGLSPRKRDR